MFEKSLSEKLARIFDLKKVTFDMPGASQEQETIFIEVVSSKNTIKDARQVARVAGKITVFCNSQKLPYGYFSKKIQAAALEDTSGLFFHDIEENAGTFGNISERTMSFIFLYDSQYDPNIGEINEFQIAGDA